MAQDGHFGEELKDNEMIFYILVDEHVQMVVEKGVEHILQR